VYVLLVKRMNFRIVTLTLIFTIMLLPTIQHINAQETETENQPIDPAILNMIKTQTMAREQEMLNLFGEGPHSPSVDNCLRQAEQAMVQAENFGEANPRAAAQQYLRAMKQYRNALRKYLKENPETLNEFTEPSSGDTAGDDVDGVTSMDVEAAKVQLLNRFQERFREQVYAMIDNVEELEDDMSPQDAERARNALQHTLQRLLRIQSRIESGQYDEAVEDLDEATEALDDEFDEIEDQTTAQMLRAMNQLEAKIQKIYEMAERKAATGENTSSLDYLLDELNGYKNEMKNSYKENKGVGGEQGNQSGNGKGGN
jgi:tetratricopeptide (TPR) repeat protein